MEADCLQDLLGPDLPDVSRVERDIGMVRSIGLLRGRYELGGPQDLVSRHLEAETGATASGESRDDLEAVGSPNLSDLRHARHAIGWFVALSTYDLAPPRTRQQREVYGPCPNSKTRQESMILKGMPVI